MDFGKFKYEEAQRAKESRRKSTNISIKEMKYRPKIGPGDFETKTRKVAEFLAEGHKVKITIMFRGREVFHPELGGKILDAIAEQVAPVGKVETHARLDGRNMTMVLAPDKRAQAAAAKREQRGQQGPTANDAANEAPAANAASAAAAVRSTAPAPSAPTPVATAAPVSAAPPEPQG
jgi:translation initiation factor IF-3